MSELIKVKFEGADGEICWIVAREDCVRICTAPFEDIWLCKEDIPKLIDALQRLQRKLEHETNG